MRWFDSYAQAGRQPRIRGMKIPNSRRWESGKIGWVLMWLVGIPVPILLILFLMRGCT
jgi:hypothetical protein